MPGQVYYKATRKLVLQGADGVVFVADSQARQLDENIESLQNLHQNILEHGIDIRTLPMVIQYNKQDLPRDLILTPDGARRRAQLPRRPRPSPPTRCTARGVFETLQGDQRRGAPQAQPGRRGRAGG